MDYTNKQIDPSKIDLYAQTQSHQNLRYDLYVQQKATKTSTMTLYAQTQSHQNFWCDFCTVKSHQNSYCDLKQQTDA